jgi:hypothetical protein
MEPAMATRWNPQTWVTSTAGDEKSVYWYPKVLAGRAQCESGVPSRSAYFEWSIPDDANIDDEDVWWEFMPALGRTIDVEFIRSRLAKARRGESMDEDDAEGSTGEGLWRRAYGNQWVRHPVLGGGAGVFPSGAWAACRGPGDVVGRVGVAFDVNPVGSRSAVGFAGVRGDGSWHGEVVDVVDPGRLVARLVEVARNAGDRLAAIGTASSGGLVPELRAQLSANGLTVEVVEVGPAKYSQACDALFGYVRDGQFRHLGQRWLDDAVAGARSRDVGDAGRVWVRRSSAVDISPLCAVTVALRVFQDAPPESGVFAGGFTDLADYDFDDEE